jgi:hypothetical protein
MHDRIKLVVTPTASKRMLQMFADAWQDLPEKDRKADFANMVVQQEGGAPLQAF